jgi:hypothetical protein
MKGTDPSKRNQEMIDHDTCLDTGDGGAAAIVAGLLAVAIVVVGLFYFASLTHDGSKAIVVDVPRVAVSVAPPGH